jgi:hypothetical protein
MTQLACVGTVLCVVFPAGQSVFADAVAAIGAFPFAALEAMVTATLGLGLFEILFG